MRYFIDPTLRTLNRNGIYQNMPDPPPPTQPPGLPLNSGYGGGRHEPDRANPFVSGGEVSSEADSVVQNFLRVRLHILAS